MRPHLIGSKCPAVRHLRLPAAREQLPQSGLRQRRTRVRRLVEARNAVELHREPLPTACALPRAGPLRTVRHRRGGAGRRGTDRPGQGGRGHAGGRPEGRHGDGADHYAAVHRRRRRRTHRVRVEGRMHEHSRTALHPRRRHAPVGQMGPRLHRIRRGRRAGRPERGRAWTGGRSSWSPAPTPSATAIRASSPGRRSRRSWAGTASRSAPATPHAPAARRRCRARGPTSWPVSATLRW